MSFVIDTLKDKGFSNNTYINRVVYLSSLKLTRDNFKDKLKSTNIIKQNSVNTKLTNAFHILSFLKNLDESLQDDDVKKMMINYSKFIDNLKQKQLVQKNVNRKPSDFVDIETMQKKLEENKPSFSIKSLRFNDAVDLYRKIENYVLISLYVNTPAIRNDYYDVNIIPNIKHINKIDNFIVLNKRGAYLILNHFKTANTFGQVKLMIDKKTTKFIKEMLNIRKDLGFISNKLFNHVSQKGLTQITQPISMIMRVRTSSEKFLGIQKSINDFRHAWEVYIQSRPEYTTMTIEERAKEHAKLLHHLPIALEYNYV